MAVLLVLFFCAGAFGQARPNVLLITLDTVRADHLGCYGGKAKTTALDALAKSGILFDHAYTAVPLTLPSHAAILTGTYPVYNGVRSQPGFRLPDGIATLAEQFAAAGYDTAAVMGASILDRRFGLARGFATYDDNIATVKEEEYAGLPAAKRSADEVVDLGRHWLTQHETLAADSFQRNRNTPRTEPGLQPLKDYAADFSQGNRNTPGTENGGRLQPRLKDYPKISGGLQPAAFTQRQRATRSFFLWLHFYDAHLPYRIPAARHAQFAPTYDGEIAYIDSALAPLLADLRAAHVYDSTIIAIVSDHGEGLGDHNESTHGLFIYNSTIRVPLIIKLAAAQQPAPAKRATETVSTVDIAPTLLRLANLPVPGSMQGIARMAAVTGRGADPVVPVYAETFFPLLSMGWNPLRALITQDHKLIQAPHSELYDLARDPGELHNQIGADRALAGSMLAELSDFVRQRTPAQPANSRIAVSAETAQLFASLGYVGGASAAPPVFTTDRRDPKDGAREAEAILDAIHVYEAQDFATAERMLRAVLRTDPDQPLALDTLGSIQFKRHELDASRATYTHLLKVAPYYGNAYAELAHTDALLGQRAEAERLYQQAYTADPSNGRALRELGLLLVDDGNLDEARKVLEQSLALQPNDFFALNALGEVHVRQGDFVAAASALEKAVAADPRLVPPRLNLGYVYLRLNHPENTLRLTEQTMHLAPRNAQAYAEIAVARIELGDPAGAERATHEALQLDPTNGMAREAQRALSSAGSPPR
jgi:arylsulfatase A-like enzyme/Tfp pilus assembly protein PilF